MDKVMTLKEAIEAHVRDGQEVYLGGFSHGVPYAAAHEIIRQGIRDLKICKMVPEMVVEQMILTNTCSKLTFSWAGNPGLGNLNILRNSVEKGEPFGLEVEEYTHYSLLLRLQAGASGLPFMMLRSNTGSDLPTYNERIKTVRCPYTGEMLSTVPAYNADVAILHAHRADPEGNVQMWGLIGENKEAAFGARTVIVTVEEIVDRETIGADPNKTILPAFMVDAVVEEPWGAHPAYVQGRYDRDNRFYMDWNRLSRSPDDVRAYIEEWVYGVENRQEYVRKLGDVSHLQEVSSDGR